MGIDVLLWLLAIILIINIPVTAFAVDKQRAPMTSGLAITVVILDILFILALVAKLTQ